MVPVATVASSAAAPVVPGTIRLVAVQYRLLVAGPGDASFDRFPLLVALILRLRAWVSIALAIVLVAIFRITQQHHINRNLMLTLYTVAPFIVGIVLAQHREALRSWYRSLVQWQKTALYIAITVLFLLHSYVRHFTDFWELVAGAGVIFLAFSSHRAHQFLTFKPFLFLGRISYSLYLVHFPVLMVLTFTLHQRLGKWWIFPIYITTALLVATVFYRWVETPSLRLSHRIAQGKPTIATQ